MSRRESLSSIGRAAVCRWVESIGGDLRAVKVRRHSSHASFGCSRTEACRRGGDRTADALSGSSSRQLPHAAGAYHDRAGGCLDDVVHNQGVVGGASGIAHAFARVVADCADYTNAHHAETASIMAAAGSVGVAVINRMQPVMNGSVLWPALIQPAINVTAILRSIDGDVPGQRYHRRARCDIESLPPDFCLAAHANVIL
jgi:hypothetical protein